MEGFRSLKWITIDEEKLMDTENLYSGIKDLNRDRYSHFFHSMSDYIELKRLPSKSSFKVLGLIAILENLLTDGKINIRSITHQLQRKIILCNNRFNTPIIFTDHFKGSESNTNETIIRKIYEYRSNIAHGGVVDFEKKLKELGNKNKVVEILDLLVKRTFMLGVKEPQLMLDLKKC